MFSKWIIGLLVICSLYCAYSIVLIFTSRNLREQNGGGNAQIAQPDSVNRCWMDFSISGTPIGRVVFELFEDVPKTAHNFTELCKQGQYNNTPVHRIVPDFMLQMGDITNGDGTGGYSMYGAQFDDENFNHKHDSPGLLSMANSGPNTNSSQFFITTKDAPWLDGKHVVFGRVVEGMDIVSKIEKVRCHGESPVEEVMIVTGGT